MIRKKLIIGEDDNAVRCALSEFLGSMNYDITETTTCFGIKQAFSNCQPDAAILDYSLPDGKVLDLLPQLKQAHPSVPLILLTGLGSIPVAVQAMKQGAEQFLTKPVQMEAIARALEQALVDPPVHRKAATAQSSNDSSEIDPFIGMSSRVREIADQAERIAQSHCPVLISGETGTGKGVLARWLHRHSPRAQDPFVDLNCAGFGRELLETELFGHEIGAFTGAVQRKTGLMEIAQRGTVFLDEIGDMDLQVQPKLLKVLEEKKFRKLGDTKERKLDVRLIAASHQDLAQLMRTKQFRSDLYFRISTVTIRIPSLRERREDIASLAEYFLQQASLELGRPHLSLSRHAQQRIVDHSWPGNIRELRNVIERAVLLCSGDIVQTSDLQFDFGAPIPGDNDALMTLQELQRAHIGRALTTERGHIGRAALRLGMSRSALYNKIKTFGISH